MSEAKFTKGPWEVGGFTPSRVYAYGEDGQRFLLASTGNIQPNCGENCHLIAAAPEMYRKLEHVAEFFDSLCEDDAANEIKALLAKARGEL